MMRHRLFLLPAVLLLGAASARPAEPGWIDLTDLEAWRSTGDWFLAGDAALAPDTPRRLVAAKPGDSVLINGKTGRTRDLFSKEEFGDLELHLEFLIAEKSNSGVKFMGLYEIQIYDSWQAKEPKADHCGGIYPRAKLLPKYHYIDEGIPPKVNAAKKPGEWQTLDVVFRAPRFDASGKKVKNARIEKAVLNGKVIHENVELETPTGHNYVKKEVPQGPLMLQGDHGPVAFRDVRVRVPEKE